MTTPELAVCLRNVSFSYNRVPVLEDVNIDIPANEFCSIVGPNGGGKTTLLKIILGAVQPDTGEVRVLGENPLRARRWIGYMPQYTRYDPHFPVTVLDVVLMGRLGADGVNAFFGWYGREDREEARAALREVEMADDSDRPFSVLSGGQRQRVLIARALCCRPKLLLLDEPTSNVDALAEEKLLAILQQLQSRMTILMVSHDLGFVSTVVRSVICVNRRVLVHPTSELTGETIREIYGGDFRMIRHDHRCSEQGHIRV
mgnify:CR=1 FL=1